MPRKNSLADPGDEQGSSVLSHKISIVIMHLMTRSHFTQAKFASEMGLSRTTLNMLLNQARGNTWRLPTLCAAARVLDLPLWEIIKTAEEMPGESVTEDVDDLTLNRLSCLSVVRATEPQSTERLFRIVGQALAPLPFQNDSWADEYRCTPEDIRAGAPQFYEDYTSGNLEDDDAFVYLYMAKMKWEKREPRGPFWTALREVYPQK